MKRFTLKLTESMQPVFNRARLRLRRLLPFKERRAWKDDLIGLAEALEALNRFTEAEFVSMGETLQTTHQKTKAIATQASAVARLLSGGEIDYSMNGFRSIRARIQEVDADSIQHKDSLKTLLKDFKAIRVRLSPFAAIVQELRMLCVSIRIESARLADRDLGFSDLAKDVTTLAGEIETRCDALNQELATLSSHVETTLKRVSDLGMVQQDQARLILNQALQSEQTLQERHNLSTDTAEGFSQRYDALSRSIGEIVMSLQFQDIVRQKIEHIATALRDVATPEEAGARPDALEAADICKLQAAQLHYARDELLNALDRIDSNIRESHQNTHSISQDVQRLIASGATSNHSFIDEMKDQVEAFSTALQGYSSVRREIRSAMTQVGSTLLGMDAFTHSIESIGFKMKLIALNAIVKASHIGSEGSALGVLAEGIHRLSLAASQHMGVVSEGLRTITGSLLPSDESGVDMDMVEADEDPSVRESGEIVAMLERISSTIHRLLMDLEADAEALNQRMEESIGDVHVYEDVETTTTQIVTSLHEMEDHLRALAPTTGLPQSSERMRALETAYTMQGERAVHQMVAARERGVEVPLEARNRARTEGGAGEFMDPPPAQPLDDLARPSALSPATDATAASRETMDNNSELGEEDLGDNVELF